MGKWLASWVVWLQDAALSYGFLSELVGSAASGKVAASCDSLLRGSWDSAFSLVRLGLFRPS